MPNRMQGHFTRPAKRAGTISVAAGIPRGPAASRYKEAAATGIRCRRQMFRQQNYSAMQTLTRFSSTLAKG